MNKTESFVRLALAALLSLAGVAGFIVLFARDMTVYWFILSPLILIVYQFPAFVMFRMWKRKRARSRLTLGDRSRLTLGDECRHRAQAPEIEEARDQGDDGGPDAAPDSIPEDEGRGES